MHLRHQADARRHLIREGVEEDLRHAHEALRQAGVAFEEARRLDGSLPEWQARYARAVAKLAEDDFEGCVADCDGVLAEDPEVEEVWKLRGDALRLAGRDPFDSYGRALAIRRGYYEVLLAQGEAYLERGAIGEARASFERALEVHPDLAEAEIGLARCSLAEARAGGGENTLAGALEWVERCLSRGADDYALRVTRAEILMERGKGAEGAAPLEEALSDLEKAAGQGGCGNRVQYLAGRARLLRARQAARAGRDPRPDLDSVLAFAEDPMSGGCDKTSPWRELLEEARVERARFEGGKGSEGSWPSDVDPWER